MATRFPPPRTEEDRRQLRLLLTPLGEPGSGMVRYGAAMYFHRSGRIDQDTLEAYRICCKLDREDPMAVVISRQQRDSITLHS